MKRDPYFKYVALALIAAVVLALASPPPAAKAEPVHASTLVHSATLSAKS